MASPGSPCQSPQLSSSGYPLEVDVMLDGTVGSSGPREDPNPSAAQNPAPRGREGGESCSPTVSPQGQSPDNWADSSPLTLFQKLAAGGDWFFSSPEAGGTWSDPSWGAALAGGQGSGACGACSPGALEEKEEEDGADGEEEGWEEEEDDAGDEEEEEEEEEDADTEEEEEEQEPGTSPKDLEARLNLSPRPLRGGLKRKRRWISEEEDEEGQGEEEEAPGPQNAWEVETLSGLKVKIKRRRLSAVLPEHHQVFAKLLEDPVIEKFLAWDKDLLASDKYLLAMVVIYFSRFGLFSWQIRRIHFFLALYLANDMEEDEQAPKQAIFSFLYGKNRFQRPQFHRLRLQLVRAMGWRARVSRQECEEIQAYNPDLWVWGRDRTLLH